jgi:hypothetical protein
VDARHKAGHDEPKAAEQIELRQFPIKISNSNNTHRHCEQSEAIHSWYKTAMDCFVASLLAMTASHSFAISPHVFARVLLSASPR